MENETECTGFLARTTIKAETKARLDKTESIIVRRPSLKWNFHAGAWKSIYYDQRGCSYFIWFFQAKSFKHSLSYLRILNKDPHPKTEASLASK